MKLLKAIATISSLTLLSRIAGFGRDMLTAIVMGAGPVSDAFFVALKLPNLFRRITAEGAFSAAFVPLFSGKLEKDGRDQAIAFARDVQAMMLAILVPFCILVVAAMPWVLHVIAPGFVDDPVRFDLAVELSRITFPYIVLISLTALLGGVMNALDRFAPFAAMPIFFNLSLVSALIYVALGGEVETPAHALVWAVIGAGVFQLLWMVYHCLRVKVFVGAATPKMTKDIRKTFKLMGPGLIGAGVAQINIFIDMILASLLPAGAISFLYYADRLYQFPLGMIGLSVGVALLPMLARKIKAKDYEKGRLLFTQAFAAGWALAIPSAVGLVVLAEPILSALFEYGAFTAEDAAMSAKALRAYALALPAFIMIRILSSASFAAEDTKTPVRYAIIGSVVNIVFSILLLKPLGHVGIALATAGGSWVNVLLLARALTKKNKVIVWEKEQVKQLLSILFCATVMAVTLILLRNIDSSRLFSATPTGKVAYMFSLVGLGGLSYFVTIFFTGNVRYFKLIFQSTKSAA